MLHQTRKRSLQELGCVGFIISGRFALSALILVGIDLHVDFTFCSICTVSNNFWGILVKVKVAQSCLTVCNPREYAVHGFLQTRILEWVAFPFSRDLPNPGIEPGSPTLQADALTSEPPGSPGILEWRACSFSRASPDPGNGREVQAPPYSVSKCWDSRRTRSRAQAAAGPEDRGPRDPSSQRKEGLLLLSGPFSALCLCEGTNAERDQFTVQVSRRHTVHLTQTRRCALITSQQNWPGRGEPHTERNRLLI